jgi:hypothetical protein
VSHQEPLRAHVPARTASWVAPQLAGARRLAGGRKQERDGGAAPRPSLADPVQTVAWGGRLPSKRRAVLGGLAGLAVGAHPFLPPRPPPTHTQRHKACLAQHCRAPQLTFGAARSALLSPATHIFGRGRRVASTPTGRRSRQQPTAGGRAVLGGNLGGASSALLAADGGGAARRLRLDVLFPVAGFRRCLDPQAGFGAAPGLLGARARLPPARCPVC